MVRRHRLRLECRECEVICERVISPWLCLKASCPCIYAYDADDTVYFGCIHKVFSPELDLAAFSGDGARCGKGSDPYGLIRVTRTPRPHCRVSVEQAYSSSAGGSSCCNPTFFQHPAAPADERIRLIVNSPVDEESGRGD